MYVQIDEDSYTFHVPLDSQLGPFSYNRTRQLWSSIYPIRFPFEPFARELALPWLSARDIRNATM